MVFIFQFVNVVYYHHNSQDILEDKPLSLIRLDCSVIISFPMAFDFLVLSVELGGKKEKKKKQKSPKWYK